MKKTRDLETTLMFYIGLRTLSEPIYGGREGVLQSIKSINNNLHLSRFNDGESMDTSDRVFVWDLINNIGQFSEDSDMLRNVEELRKYEEENDVDLYQSFLNGESYKLPINKKS